MEYQTYKFVKAALFSMLFSLPFGSANATVIMDTWNDVDLNASGDYVAVEAGDDASNTWFSMQWGAGGDNLLGALGIDTVFYNSSVSVSQVWEGEIGGSGTNVTGSWSLNFGGVTAGGGFGDFLSRKNLDGGTTAGITNPIFFLLNGLTDFPGNSNGSSFAAHVRYEQGCSGWVSDGRTESRDSGNCGTVSVPEPSSLALLGIGLLGLRLAHRRR